MDSTQQNNSVDIRKSQHYIYLDYLRIFAVLGVVVLHTAASNWYNQDIHTYTWKCFSVWNSIVRWSVAVFVMISGALFLNRDITIKRLYGKYILRMVVAYLFWSGVYVLYAVFHNPTLSMAEILEMFIRGHYHMWFIPMIIGLYIIVPVLRQIIANRKITKYYLVISLFFTFFIPTVRDLIYLSLPYISNEKVKPIIDVTFSTYDNTGIHLVLGYTAYFILGYYINTTTISKKKEILIYVLSISGFISTVLISLFFAKLQNQPFGFYGNMELNILFESIGVFVFFRCRLWNLKTSKYISILSKYTFGIYLMHTLILEMLDYYFSVHTLVFNSLISVPFVATITFIISLLISGVLNQIPFVNKYIV